MGSTSTTTRTSMQLASVARVTPHSPPMLDGPQEPLQWFDGISFSASKPTYSVYGASVSEVLLDVMTGETRLERVVQLMDLARSWTLLWTSDRWCMGAF